MISIKDLNYMLIFKHLELLRQVDVNTLNEQDFEYFAG